ncbi:hypothetical protein ACQP1G_20730 [Nocardia sp. CA-107356]|uniref:hypothetical protein n=1 Tax=Nocardia sp. CA-107356 TaxID=3239972 RepID=UPI003D910162
MTAALHPVSDDLPGPDTVVLCNVALRSGTDPKCLSRFGDDRWNLSPGVLHRHSKAISVDFTRVPDEFRVPVKHILWLLLNDEPGKDVNYRFTTARLTMSSASAVARFLRSFAQWLHARGIARLAAVTAADLDAYAVDVRAADFSHGQREDLLAAVVRAWSVRGRLLPADRLPEAPPWNGDRLRDVLGTGREVGENRTPRIHPDTMTALLAWSLRFVEVFADDIVAAFTEYLEISSAAYRMQRDRLPKNEIYSRRRPPGQTRQLLLAHLDEYRRQGHSLPGKRSADGRLVPNAYFLSAQAGIAIHSRSLEAVFAEHGAMPIDDDTYLFAPITARLDGRRWQNRSISYAQAPVLARHLTTACFVITAYLSGQRPGETLNLERGCITRDPATGMILLRGKHFKGVRNTDGTPATDGVERVDPWVVVEPVATAVQVVGRLHEAPLLFPNTMEVNGRSSPDQLKARTVHAARNDQLMTQDIDGFIDWVNQYCATQNRTDAIPADPVKASISLGRLRRTLAWFIVRRPRGLVAAAIQYGHIRTGMTLGYAGDYDSGFPDDLVFEEWLTRLDALGDAHQRLRDGEHVSGPAAEVYRQRVESATRFAGRVLRTSRDAAALLANPDLQIYQGNAMTCVLDPARAACRLAGDDQGTRRTPDITNCRPTCANIARTDRDIAELLRQADQLRLVVADPLAPPIRSMRERRELTRIEKIIADHRSS